MSFTIAMALSLLFLSLLDPTIARDPFSSKAASEPSKILKDACNHTEYYDFCVNTISLDPSSRTADLVGLVGIAVKFSVDNTTSTSNYVQKLWRESWNQTNLHMVLDSCNDDYISALGDLQNTADEFYVHKDYTGAVEIMGKCMLMPMSCEDANRSLHMSLSHLSDINMYLDKLLHVGLALLQLLT
ncbi:cell wall / vacuolar inhibitor of fructosidase 2-like [Amborella trichopoda]|nr:cell wall / vacuolar inhibitor of fructosidase 2-like [Amborella trichopoda]|eukprot:XP_011620610.1 cell wall / vacuolar inhibitor of fructosidase 2-like [Amborella trichopoda]